MPNASPHEADRRKIWDAADGKTAILITRMGDVVHARPMSPILRPDDGLIWFLSDVDTGKLDDIETHPQVAVSFSNGSSEHVSFEGSATVSNDRATIAELWSPPANAFYPDGPGDPKIRLIRFEPDVAELWSSPGRLLAMFQMVAAVAAGTSARDIASHVKATL